MEKDELRAALLFLLGALLMLGAMGDGDYYGFLSAWDFIKIALGLIIWAFAFRKALKSQK